MEQRPAAVVGLLAAQIIADLGFDLGRWRFADLITKEDIFRRDRRVGLKFENEVPIVALNIDQRLGAGAHRRVDFRERGRPQIAAGKRVQAHFRSIPSVKIKRQPSAKRASAAEKPERMAPSIVAGTPVFVQSPASRRLARALRVSGRRASSSGVAAKVARFSFMICHVGSGDATSVTNWISDQILAASSSRGRGDEAVGAADRHRKPAGEGEKPFHRPVHDAENGRLAGRRFDLVMGVHNRAKRLRRGQSSAKARQRPVPEPRGRRGHPAPARPSRRRRRGR